MRKILQDDDLEYAMGNLLRLGVIISSAIVAIGGIIYLYKHGMHLPEYATFIGNKSMFNSVSKIITGLKEWKGQAIIQLGILVLIFTPIARITFSFIGFLEEAKCGDLAFFDNEEGRITHVGILLNAYTIIHASGYVKIDAIDNMGIITTPHSKRTHHLRLIKSFR